MPRGRGGRRQGTKGRPHPERGDIRAQAVKAAPGQAYGAAQMQREAQEIIPLPQAAPIRSAPTGNGQAGPPPGLVPTPLDAPTGRPNESVTTGLPMGPGAGPEVLGLGPQNVDDALEILRGYFLAYPLDELRELIEMAEAQQSNVAPVEPGEPAIPTEMSAPIEPSPPVETTAPPPSEKLMLPGQEVPPTAPTLPT